MVAKNKAQKKKKTKAAKVNRQILSSLSEGELREKVEELLARGKPREAIRVIQQSSFGDSPEIVPLRIVAYTMRARQLEEKGLVQEAEAVMTVLEKPPLLPTDLPCGELSHVLRMAPLAFALKWYREHGKKHPSCPVVERAMADMFVFTRRWEELDRLAGDDPVRKDGTLMVEAMPDLDAGRWEEGVKKLASLSRKSPFAGWKWFAKAMATSCNGDSGSLDRSLKQLPDDFPLKIVVGALRKDGCAALEKTREWLTRPILAEADILVNAIRNRENKLAESIRRFASAIFPQSPDDAMRPLTELAAVGLVRGHHDIDTVAKLLPSDLSRSIVLRMEIFHPHFKSAYDRTPFCAALKYRDMINLDFSHVARRQRVEAALYHRLLSILVSDGAPHVSELSHKDRNCLSQWLKNDRVKSEDTYLALAEKITRLAPDVIEYYRTLGELEPRYASTEGKALFEKAMQAMLRQYPEDPFPYLKLARFYSIKGAYRKSEKILDDAWKQAPYDSGVKEEYALSLLKAAMRSANRKSLQIAWTDVDRAAGLEVKNQVPLVHAVKATVRYLEEGNPDQQLKTLLDIPELSVSMRSLVYFYGFMEIGRDFKSRNFSSQIQKKAQKLLDGNLKELPGNQLMEMVAPVPDEHHTLAGEVDMAEFFGSMWPKIFGKLDDQHVLTIYALVLGTGEPKQIRQVKKDLQKRLSRRRTDIFFRFYEIIVDYELDESFFRAQRFDALIQSLEPDDTVRLRNFCRSIARYFTSDQLLFNALNSFNFYELVDFPSWGDPFFPMPGMDDDDDEDDFDLFNDLEGMGGTLDDVEGFLKDLNKLSGNKQLLGLLLEMMLSMIKSQGLDPNGIRQMGILLEKEVGEAIRALRELYSGNKKKELSKEGRLLLFPYE